MSEQVVQLKRSDKNYIGGFRTAVRKVDEVYKELAWLDKNLELLRSGRTTELRKLWITTDYR